MSRIIPNLFLGNINDAKTGKYDIILNVSEIPISRNKIRCINIPMIDDEKFRIDKYFKITNSIIDNALNNNLKILVNCHMGISRSATIVIHFLMKKFNINKNMAYSYVKKKRNIIYPNEGFWKQLK